MLSASRPSGVRRMNSASSVCIVRYTFRMRTFPWLLILGVVIAAAYALVRWRRQWAERQKAGEERFVTFIAQTKPAVPAPSAPAAPLPQPDPHERLLLEAAGKAGRAGGRGLSIPLYSKPLSRHPHTPFAPQAPAAGEEQKKKLAKAQRP